MKLRMERTFSEPELGTTGVLFMDGDWSGHTLEDEYREKKVAGETRIPAGAYEIKLRTDSPMAEKYRERYGDWHEGMLWLQDVPGFEWIYIHAGNTPDHTEGCIIVGYGAMHVPGKAPSVMTSRLCYEALARAVHGAVGRGEAVSIEIVDRDR